MDLLYVKLEIPIRYTSGHWITKLELGQRSWLAITTSTLSVYRSLSWRPRKKFQEKGIKRTLSYIVSIRG